MKFSWRMLFEDFKNNYPNIWKRGTVYQPYDFMTILVVIPGVGKFTYEYYHKKLTMIEDFENESEKRARLREESLNERLDRQTRFMQEVPMLMRERNMTQAELSERSGVSRQSINAYLTKRKIPKEETLRKIYESLEES